MNNHFKPKIFKQSAQSKQIFVNRNDRKETSTLPQELLEGKYIKETPSDDREDQDIDSDKEFERLEERKKRRLSRTRSSQQSSSNSLLNLQNNLLFDDINIIIDNNYNNNNKNVENNKNDTENSAAHIDKKFKSQEPFNQYIYSNTGQNNEILISSDSESLSPSPSPSIQPNVINTNKIQQRPTKSINYDEISISGRIIHPKTMSTKVLPNVKPQKPQPKQQQQQQQKPKPNQSQSNLKPKSNLQPKSNLKPKSNNNPILKPINPNLKQPPLNRKPYRKSIYISSSDSSRSRSRSRSSSRNNNKKHGGRDKIKSDNNSYDDDDDSRSRSRSYSSDDRSENHSLSSDYISRSRSRSRSDSYSSSDSYNNRSESENESRSRSRSTSISDEEDEDQDNTDNDDEMSENTYVFQTPKQSLKTLESSSSSEKEEYKKNTAILPEYQGRKYNPRKETHLPPILIYNPYVLSEEEIDRFISDARNKLNEISKNMLRAGFQPVSVESIPVSSILDILHEYAYDTVEALRSIDFSTISSMDLSLKDHIKSIWTPEEEELFCKQFIYLGRDNLRMMPTYIKTKNLQEVIEYYYYWKVKCKDYKKLKKNQFTNPKDKPLITANSTRTNREDHPKNLKVLIEPVNGDDLGQTIKKKSK